MLCKLFQLLGYLCNLEISHLNSPIFQILKLTFFELLKKLCKLVNNISNIEIIKPN